MRYDKVEITRRDALAGGLGAGALLALAACGAGGTSSNNSSVSASPPSSEANFYKRAGSKAGTKSISVLAADAPQTNAIKALVGQFEQLTGISVRWTALAETAEQSKLNVSLGSGAASYDVIYGSSVETSNYITRNWLASIDTLAHNKDVTSPKWSKKPYGTTSLAQLSQHNTLYGVPWFAGTQVLWYRTDIFKDHGITAPPKTFADLENICKKIHSSSTAAIALRTQPAPTQLMYSWTAWLYAYGGKYYKNYDNGKYSGVALDSPQAARALELYSTLVRKYGPTGSTNWSVEDVSRAFLTGRVAMVQEGLTFGSTFTDPKQSHVVGKVGSAVLPSGPAGHFVPYAVGAWSVADNSKHKDAGWLFVQWATSLSTLKSAVLGGQAFATPTVSSIYKTSEYKKKYGFDHFSEVSASTLDLANGTGHVSPLRGDSSYEPSSGRWTAIGTRVSQKLNLAVTGQASPQRAVAEAAKAMNG